MTESLPKEITIKSIDDLARTLDRCRGNYSFLVGAGTSRAAGIKTSSELIDQWISEKYSNLNLEQNKNQWVEKIESQIPEYQNRYGFWFESRYTTREERRQFIKSEVEDADPTFEHIVLSSLMKEGYIPITLTPNFDDLIYDAFYLYHEKRPFLVDHNAIAPQFKITHEDPMIVKLHGDYLYDNLKNTANETSELEENVDNVLRTTLNEYGLIVLGYAGKDESIMDVLSADDVNIPDYGLFWCTMDKNNLSEGATQLLKNENTFLIEIESSQDFFYKLYDRLDDLNVPTPVDIRGNAEARAEQLRDGIVQVGGRDILVLASEYLRRDEYSNAIDLLNDAIETEGESPQLLAQRAKAFGGQENYDQAINNYNTVLEIMKNNSVDDEDLPRNKDRYRSNIINGLAIARARAGYYNKAIEDYKEHLENNPEDSTSHANLAEVQILDGRLDEGISSAEQALSKAESDSEEANALMIVILGKVLDEDEYETEKEKFEQLCRSGIRKTWNFTEIDDILDNSEIPEKKKDVIETIKQIYEDAEEKKYPSNIQINDMD